MITTSHDLTKACARFAQAQFITVDTEFLRETTFWPKLCVVQLADDTGAEAVDALAPGLDLTPLFQLMSNTNVLKVFHSGRQDIEIFWNLAGLVPSPVFDTQIAAMVLGYGDSVAYDQLVQQITGIQLDKSSRFTDWSRRPLFDSQIEYALADVIHLRDVYRTLAEQLAIRGRTTWIDEEMQILTSAETYLQSPEYAWKRLKARIKKPRELATLIEVAAWREREAQARNVPRSRILKDDQLADIASKQPQTADALAQLRGIPHGFERSKAGLDVIEAVKTGLACDLAELPPIERPRPSPHNAAAVIELLRVLLKLVAEREEVAPKVVASQDDLEKIARGETTGIPALEDWRLELFGKYALDLKHGKIGIALSQGKVVLIPTPVGA
jgi:ribonuclease D